MITPHGGHELGTTLDPRDLIPGDPATIHTSIDGSHQVGQALVQAGEDLAGIDTAHWTGAAADAFHARFHPQPARWGVVGRALLACGTALVSWADALTTAQNEAAEAIGRHAIGQAATQAAKAAYNQAVDTYNQAAAAYRGGPLPVPPPPFVDPGEADRRAAHQLLDHARATLAAAAADAHTQIAAAHATLDPAPRGLTQLGDDLADGLRASGTQLAHLGGGLVDGVESLVKLGRATNPLDPYNLTHPSQYLHNLGVVAQGLVDAVRHPISTLKTMVDWRDWAAGDPGRAIGQLAPTVLAGAATGGAAGALDAATGGLAGLARAGAGKILDAVGGSTTDAAASAGEKAALAATDTASADHPFAGWTGHTPPAAAPGDPLAAADTTAAGHLGDAASGMGQLHNEINDVASRVHTPDTTTPSGTPVLDAPPAHRPPTLPDRLAAADTTAARGITDAGADLDRIHREIDDLNAHIHTPEPSPAGPEHNNPDYSDPRYEIGSATRERYRAKYPNDAGDYYRFVQRVKRDNPDFASLRDEELHALVSYTGSFYGPINRALRAGDQAALADLDAKIRALASGLNKLPDYQGDVVRGVTIPLENMDSFLAGYRPGMTVEEPSFISADKETPFGGNVRFYIESTCGKDISAIADGWSGEQEVLFPPGESFMVLDRSYNSDDDVMEIFLRDMGRQ